MALITCAIITALMHESHIHIAMFVAVTVARVCDNLVVRTLGYAYVTAVLLLRPLILQQSKSMLAKPLERAAYYSCWPHKSLETSQECGKVSRQVWGCFQPLLITCEHITLTREMAHLHVYSFALLMQCYENGQPSHILT